MVPSICINRCPCPVFVVPPRTLEDYDAGRYHLHEGCIIYHDGEVCSVPPAQPGLPLEDPNVRS